MRPTHPLDRVAAEIHRRSAAERHRGHEILDARHQGKVRPDGERRWLCPFCGLAAVAMSPSEFPLEPVVEQPVALGGPVDLHELPDVEGVLGRDRLVPERAVMFETAPSDAGAAAASPASDGGRSVGVV
mgnify:CR=1 FL=1